MKKLLAILLAVMMVFCLAACGDKDEKKKDKKDSEKSSSYASALEESRIHTDEAYARALKSLIATEYMWADPGSWNAAQTYYVDEDCQKILTSSSGAMKYKSKKYKDNGYISGTCSDEGIITVNCEGIYENTDNAAPADNDNAGAMEISRIRTDEANARALKSLAASAYMSGEFDASFATAGTTEIKVYLNKNGQTYTLTSGDGEVYKSTTYGKGTKIEATVKSDGIITVNCSGVPCGTRKT